MAEAKKVLELSDIQAGYGDTDILHGINMHVCDDEVGHDGRIDGEAVRRADEEVVDPKPERSLEIETESIDPASLRGGEPGRSPATETSGSRLAEAWED